MKDSQLFDIWYRDCDFISDELKKLIKLFKENGFNVLQMSEPIYTEKLLEIGSKNIYVWQVLQFEKIGYDAIYVRKNK